MSSKKIESCRVSLAGEVIHRDRIFEQGIIAGHHGNSAVGDEVALPVGLRIVADGCAFRDVYVAINDGLADATMPPHIYVREENAVVDFAVGIYSHIGGEHAVFHRAPGNDAARRNDGISRGSGGPG